MATPDDTADDIFLPGGRLRTDLLTGPAGRALEQAVRFSRETRWDSVRSPHVFMGLLAEPDRTIRDWGGRFQADLALLLEKFQEWFSKEGEDESYLALNREFLSDNVIRLLRDARARAGDHGRDQVGQMDLLISLLTQSRSIVAECFEGLGLTAARLTELAVLAEHASRDNGRGEKSAKPT